MNEKTQNIPLTGNRQSSFSIFEQPNQSLIELSKVQEKPCLSLYQPTHRHHPENSQDPLRFRNLVKQIETSLQKEYSDEVIQSSLKPFRQLENNHEFWNHTYDGLAILSSPGTFRTYRLQRPVAELAVVADTFHIKPLVRILQSADRYQILSLNQEEIKLFEGNRDVLDEIELAAGVSRTPSEVRSDELTGAIENLSPEKKAGLDKTTKNAAMRTEHFFRTIDREILAHHSRPSGLPLLLVGLPESQALFRSLSHNPFLMPEGIDTHPDALPVEVLRERAWKAVRHYYLARLTELVEVFGEAKTKKRGSDELQQIAHAAADGRIATLLIEADRQVPGHLNSTTGEIHFDDSKSSLVDDLLDDLGEHVIRMGGQIVIAPADRMPTRSGAAAIYRY